MGRRLVTRMIKVVIEGVDEDIFLYFCSFVSG